MTKHWTIDRYRDQDHARIEQRSYATWRDALAAWRATFAEPGECLYLARVQDAGVVTIDCKPR